MALNLHTQAPPTPVPRTGGGDYFSASQHKTYRMCKRKWWMEKVAKVKDNRPRTFLAVGKALHGVSERYLAQATTTWDGLFPKGWDVGLLPEQAAFIRKGAKEAVELGVWAATPGVRIEEPVMYLVGPEFRDHHGLPLVVKPITALDKHGERQHQTPQTMLDGTALPSGWNRLPRYIGFLDVLKVSQAKIEDHKSAKNRRYASTPAKLAKDEQLLSYTPLVFHLCPDITEVTIQHNVFLKDPDDKKPTYAVQAQVTLPMAVAHWDTIVTDIQDSQALRQRVVPDLSNPPRRADRYLEVPGAADEGPARIKEACEAYSGCPYKDMCMLRCTAQQMVARMDVPGAPSAPPPKLAPVPTLAQRLAPRSSSAPLMRPFTTPTTPDATMPFPPKPTIIAAGQDGYLLDPENPAVQFRARVMSTDGVTLVVALFPHVDVLPDFHSLGAMYRAEIPRTTFLPVADLKAKITGYQAALIAGGYNPFGTQWTTEKGELIDDAIKVARINGGPQPLESKPASAGAAQVAQMTRSQEAESSANEVVPPASFTPFEGQSLIVAHTTHPFWSKHVGKTARVTDVSPGDGGTHVLTVDMEGFDYPNVAAGRFLPVQVGAEQLVGSPDHSKNLSTGPLVNGPNGLTDLGRTTALRPGVTMPGEVPEMIARAKTMVGKLVEVNPMKGGPVIALLEDAHTEGITMISGQVKFAWDQIESITLRDPAAIPPGGKPPRMTKEEKAAAKEAEAAQAKARAELDAEATRIANRPYALQNAVTTLDEFLAGTKVSRKMLETLQPLLAEALIHQQTLTGELNGQVAAHQHTANDWPQALDPTKKEIEEAQARIKK